MKTYCFSRSVQEYLNKPESSLKKLLYKCLHEKKEQGINPLLDPNPEDIKIILGEVEAIANYCVESSDMVEGILYLSIVLGGVRANVMASKTREEVCHDILTCYRQYWIDTRGLDPAPFIPLITPKLLQLAVPISIQGYRTLAEIQNTQASVQHKCLEEQAELEMRKARALKNYRHL